MSGIDLENINKFYGDIHSVKDINLSFAENEFVVLVGPSGCGKTTTLRMIAGLETISSGKLSIGGKRANGLSPAERDIAMVFQNYALYPSMTVFENMAFGLRNRKVANRLIEEKVAKAATVLDIGHLLQRKPRQLSGGQQQRVALGRCLVRDPKVFLFDEPLSNLDAKLRLEMRQELKRLRTRIKATSVYVTHDQVEAMTLGDRVVVMHNGEVQQFGTPEEIYESPANTFVATFIGAPSMNLFQGTVSEGPSVTVAGFASAIPIRSLNGARPVAGGQKVIVGIRPEHFTLEPRGTALLSGEVSLVEYLGAGQLIEIELGSQIVTLSMPTTHQRIGVGQVLGMAVEHARVQVFDAETGARIATGAQSDLTNVTNNAA